MNKLKAQEFLEISGITRATITDLAGTATIRGLLQRCALAVLLQHDDDDMIPTNNRFVFYVLEQLGIIKKSEPGDPARGDAENLSDAIMWLRQKGIIPWDWIEDETRSIAEWAYASSAKQFFLDRLRELTLNPWSPDEPPMLIVESRSLAGILRGLASRYCVPITATNGQVGGFLRTDALPVFKRHRRVLYLGDLDLAGEQIEANTRKVLEDAGGDAQSWKRVAITEDQASALEEGGMTPLSKLDKRYKPPRTHEAWETEALGQRRIVELVTEAFDDLLSPITLAGVQVQVQRERDLAQQRLERWA